MQKTTSRSVNGAAGGLTGAKANGILPLLRKSAFGQKTYGFQRETVPLKFRPLRALAACRIYAALPQKPEARRAGKGSEHFLPGFRINSCVNETAGAWTRS